MSKIRTAVRKFVRNEEGATMVEYALLVALIAVVVIAAVSLLGSAASAKLNTAAQSISSS
ncbi:Flp family type IVb pilin [Roseisolibacter sp. H3M3-2]|uniref:Flp family type IVb pilin n=1 Tax=Roseisolibacter sp. H3M3-2 TaxID=3031323 RepID=UPI0023DBA96B|nr:Flp family type IVb pilin [Roseisolibacter sp. H3M3-2]MDF1501878.1 Flp family type IVb pilin [Roseisolibacter sp. H3M3-2]